MDVPFRMARFPDLLEHARASCGDGSPYDLQQTLISKYRAKASCFMARMPLRHKYVCPHCGKSEGEVIIYLEDPKHQLAEPTVNEMWPGGVGACATVSVSLLHQIAEHAMEPPKDLVVVLGGTAA